MHFLLKKNQLRKIRQLLSVSFEGLGSRDNSLCISCGTDGILFFIAGEYFYFEFFLRVDEDLEIFKEGTVSINPRTFNSLLEKINLNNNLEIFKAEENYLQFFSGDFLCNLIFSNLKPNYYRKVDIPDNGRITFPYRTLRATYLKLKDFCKNQENNISKNTVLTNIHFRKDGNLPEVEVWASDSYRTVFGKFEFDRGGEFEVNIPPEFLNVLLNLFSEFSEGDVDMWILEDNLVFRRDDLFIQTRINTGNYPRFIQWFDTDKNIEFSVNRSELLSAVDRNLLLANKNLKTTYYKLDDDRLWIEYKDSEKGSCKEFIGARNLLRRKIDFSLNSVLLKSLIRGISSERIIFSISSSLKPIVILPEAQGDNFKQFILPTRNA